MYAKTINKIKEKSEQDVNSLKWALESISLDEKTEKRMTKEELSENVISSIIRYYNNVLNELEMFNEGKIKHITSVAILDEGANLLRLWRTLHY